MHEFNDFSSIRISLASPEQIKSWSYGEVTKPETINYRTLKPERDGLFCERIFGPTKDFECYCGKYKKIRYKGVICDKCGVEVTHSSVRRERMGHIQLAAPVAHIWFVKVTPSRLGLLLNLSPRKLEQVIYFAKFIITRVDEDARARTIDKLKDDLEFELMQRHESAKERIAGIGSSPNGEEPVDSETDVREEEDAVSQIQHQVGQDELRLHEELMAKIEELEELEPLRVLGVNEYRELKRRWGDIFEAKIGAEAILDILTHLDLEKLRQELHQEVADSSGQHWKKVIKRLRVVEAFLKQGTKPEWMIMTVLPVIPPELRPMVQLDGGRFATSDLNDLYRRVINRNNRLRRLMEMGTPEVIIRNEKRMLQEAVDSLIDNRQRGRAVTTRSGHELKSLSDMLRGKQGHFRQNLLGKRVDYSGRSVIVPGPELKLHQCGLPKRMALELFKPFVMRQLIARGLAYNVRNAKRTVEQGNPIVWDILEEVVQDHPVLLNRAPTLHRLGIQAFQPVLIDDSAIQLHPLVCAAFNADFDGDQMAVHIPLSRLTIEEAREVMLSSKNMLLPSSGEPVVVPTMELALGCYYLTTITPGSKGEGMNFADFDDARMAYDLGVVDLGAEITVHHHDGKGPIKTSVGRIIFNDALPDELGFRNELVDKKLLKRLTSECYRRLGNEATASMLDGIKRLGFEYSTKSGLTVAISDLHIPADKNSIIHRAEEEVGKVESQFQDGLKTEDERYQGIVRIWSEATDELTRSLEKSLDRQGSIYMMANSGARGNIGQIRQMAGMRGLMSDPSGRIIELPIKTNFREGLSVLEYFISTHGARKGLADTALRTSDSGYLTRRLIDVAQQVIVKEEDCGTEDGLWLLKPTDKGILPSLSERIVARLAARPVIHPETGEVIVDRNGEIDTEKAAEIAEAGVTEVCVRSPLRCRSRRGICQRCYGIDLGRGQVVDNDVAVGIIAAQSIGEPGTQLTMRTFHTGGVAGLDIISGLPRVEELLEARVPKGQAVIAQIDGVIDIIDTEDGRKIKILNSVVYRDEYPLPPEYEAVVSEGQVVDADQVLALPIVEETAEEGPEHPATSPILARVGGKIEIRRDQVEVLHEEREEWEHLAPPAASLLVRKGDTVKAGDQLTEGTLNPQDILQIMGMEAVQRYLVDEVQKVYRSQGVNIHDKHIEIIVGQMLRRVRIDSPGDTRILPGELIDRFDYETLNANVLAEGGEPATAHPVLLGITRASLSTPSFLAAASFQETTRVLTEAAIMGSVDRLVGLKENVIIGKLIPSRSKVSRDQLEAAEILAPEPLLSQGQARQELALIEPMQLPAGEEE
ncbi:DNA-directed RNA polymerase subunit beta' [Dehalococcoidia bacterium]|nr:DNA-directed RNA polymerase subunit beta' [Dehalococcoidia bacterium]